ncbi:ATP-binding protein [Lysinibacillus xylanilyticus]|uniref:ATP-binding protein n=1 Tax=Lysinibacillus xylanilyticus TaxID=582475 RepID=UPI0037F380EF
MKNAIAYSDSNSTIKISAINENNQTFISFSNKGKTIPTEKLNMIFEKFIDSSKSTQTDGAGLGLAISNEIVQAHGGTIKATSKNEKTVFTVIIPNKP